MTKVDYSTVEKSIRRLVDLTHNFAPLFDQIVGKYGDRRDWTIIGGIQRSFIQQRDPTARPWNDLSPGYAKRKMAKFPNKSILIATGTLFNSLVYGDRGNVYIIEPTRLTYGTVIPYGMYHQEGNSKLPQRKFLGWSKDQTEKIKSLVAMYVKQVWEAL